MEREVAIEIYARCKLNASINAREIEEYKREKEREKKDAICAVARTNEEQATRRY